MTDRYIKVNAKYDDDLTPFETVKFTIALVVMSTITAILFFVA